MYLLRRSSLVLGLVLLAALAAASLASAAPVTVNLRLEGKTATYFEGSVTTDTRTVDGHDGTGAHPCDNGASAPTAGAALAAASDAGAFSWVGQWSASLSDLLVTTIGGETPDFSVDQTFWGFYVNGAAAQTGVCHTPLSAGDDLVLAVAKGTENVLKLTSPASAQQGQPAQLTVTDAGTGAPVAGASVGGATTDAAGHASVTFATAGDHSLKAAGPNAIRSNAAHVCVYASLDGTCGTPHVQVPGTIPAPLRAALTGIADGRRFAAGRGPRTLTGHVVTGSAGLLAVKLRLTRRHAGRCQYYSGRLERLRDTRCGRAFWFGVGRDADFSYLLPARLPSGRYVLDVEAIDRDFHRDATPERGRSRVVFSVG